MNERELAVVTFMSLENLTKWVNENNVKVHSVTHDGYMFVLFYWEYV